MLTKEEVAEVYSENLVLTKGTEHWLPITEKQLKKLIKNKYKEEENIDIIYDLLKNSTFQINNKGRIRQILPLKSFRILPIEGGEIEGIKFSVTKPTITGTSQNFSQTFYDVKMECEKRTENIVLATIRSRNKLFFGSAGTDKPMKTEKICGYTNTELWYPPMLAGIYIMQSAYMYCLTPIYGYHTMFRFMWNVGQYVLEQAIDVESRLPFKTVSQKLINILNNRVELAAACEPAAWEVLMQNWDIDE